MNSGRTKLTKAYLTLRFVEEIDAQVQKVVVTLGGSVEEELQVFEVNTVGISTLRMISTRSSLCACATCFKLATAAVVEIKVGIAHTSLVPEDLALIMSVNLPEEDKIGCDNSA
jgi:hypothetical protein